MAQARPRDGGEQLRALLVGEVPAAPPDALHEAARAVGALQHQRIVVELDRERVAVAQVVADDLRHRPEVGREAEPRAAVRHGEADGVAGVVRNGERLEPERPDLERGARGEGDPRPVRPLVVRAAAADDVDRAVRRVERRPVAVLQHGDRGGVVRVVVREADARQRRGVGADRAQRRADALGVRPRVDQHGRAVRLDVGAVAGAGAREDGELHFTLASGTGTSERNWKRTPLGVCTQKRSVE